MLKLPIVAKRPQVEHSCFSSKVLLILVTHNVHFTKCYSNKSREEMIRDQILQSEMRVAAQMGLPSTRLLGTALLSGTGRPGLNNISTTLHLSPDKFNRDDNFTGMSVLGSLGFTSPMQSRLNNTLSPDNSFKDDDTHSQHSYNE